ncbi:MAG: type III PLP-dependent enzyme, partial [Alphaproteobacteria bacterium]
VIVSEVVLVVDGQDREDNRRWVYLDIGRYSGLAETLDEAILYPILTNRDDEQSDQVPVVLAGPSCDSTDTLYDKANYHLPATLQVGDRVMILSAGAYTASYASVGFNGFEPLKTFCI